jgi:glyceraldehyde-3-phosphate dehydrogenase/erythrose-4-phosphate dehydrogenase
VMECTGVFLTRAKLQPYFDLGVKKVCITFVLGTYCCAHGTTLVVMIAAHQLNDCYVKHHMCYLQGPVVDKIDRCASSPSIP